MSEEQKQAPTGASPLPDMLQSLLSNPEMLKTVGSMLGAMSSAQASQNQAPTQEPATPQSENTAATDAPPASPLASMLSGGDGLASLLSDPAMLEKLPQIISVMKPLLSSMPSPKPTPPSHPKSPQDNRDNLLLALKPFLSPERRDAVDSIIRISKLGTVFHQLK